MPLNKKDRLLFVHIPRTAGNSIELALGMQYPGTGSLYSLSHNEKHGVTPQHLRLSEIIQELVDIQDYNIFTVVRNPFERFVSAYRYNIQLALLDKRYLSASALNIAEMPMHALCTNDSRPAEIKWGAELALRKSKLQPFADVAKAAVKDDVSLENFLLSAFEPCLEYIVNLKDEEKRSIFDGHFDLQSNYLDVDTVPVKIFRFEELPSLTMWLEELLDKPVAIEESSNTSFSLPPLNLNTYQKYFTDNTRDIVANLYKKDLNKFEYSWI